MQPGTQRTVSFEVEAPPSDKPVRGRLLISLTDWDLTKDGAMTFAAAATSPRSAAPWITYSPAALTTISGRKDLVRVTVTLPAEVKPGEYRTGLFIQERPPATPPARGEHQVVFRFRHFVALYVILPPVAPRATFTNVAIDQQGAQMRLVCSMKNEGSIHVRPNVTWAVRDQNGQELSGAKRYESTVLLPFAVLDEAFQLQPLAAGKYEVSASVDFHDGGPVQSITRSVEIAAPVALPAPPGVN